MLYQPETRASESLPSSSLYQPEARASESLSSSTLYKPEAQASESLRFNQILFLKISSIKTILFKSASKNIRSLALRGGKRQGAHSSNSFFYQPEAQASESVYLLFLRKNDAMCITKRFTRLRFGLVKTRRFTRLRFGLVKENATPLTSPKRKRVNLFDSRLDHSLTFHEQF